MITVTRLNNTVLLMNADLIETIEANSETAEPDSVIMLTSGKKWVVSESPHELVEKIIAYKRRCYPDIRQLYNE